MGWQRQDHGPSVQQTLEEALTRITGEEAAFTAAGRTDAGVHALAMTAHVDVERPLTAHRLREGLNALVRPQPIAVLDVEQVAVRGMRASHASGVAIGTGSLTGARLRRSIRAGLAYCGAARCDAMRDGAAHLVGRHDFTTFRSAQCQAESPVKTLDKLDVLRQVRRSTLTAEARSFLHHQVRSMVGCLALVGRGQWKPTIGEGAGGAEPGRARIQCAPRGLYFVGRLPLDQISRAERAAFPTLGTRAKAIGARQKMAMRSPGSTAEAVDLVAETSFGVQGIR